MRPQVQPYRRSSPRSSVAPAVSPPDRQRQTGLPAARLPVGQGQAGFSLPEIMVVLAIIMLLVAMMVPRMRGAKERAEEAAAAETMRSVRTAQEAHRITHGSYAPSFSQLRQVGGSEIPQGETGTGSSGESILVHQGYIFRLTRPLPDEYIVSAEPTVNRGNRSKLTMDHQGLISGLGSSLSGGSEEAGGGAGTGPGDEEEEPPPDQPPS